MPKKTEIGLMVGKFSFSSSWYETLVIPRRYDIDALASTPPRDVYKPQHLYKVNSRTITEFYRGVAEVEYTMRIKNVGGNPYPEAIPEEGKSKFYEIDIEDPLKTLKNVDPDAVYDQFTETPRAKDLLLAILRNVSVGASHLSKRAHATQFVTAVIEDDGSKIPVVMSIGEAWLWITDNLGLLRGIVRLPLYRLMLIIAEPVKKDVFLNEIVNSILESFPRFKLELDRITSASIPSREDELDTKAVQE